MFLTPVGASLLAKRPCQSILIGNVSPLSRASSLPQGLDGVGEDALRQRHQGLLGMPYLRSRMAIALCEVCRRAASKRLEG
ncbi:hypothetical protein CUN63_00315 [Pseudomonas sp. ACM7]|nr:hypothetical protein CUN63_00315 [Pseudomonas sp. ACM7]